MQPTSRRSILSYSIRPTSSIFSTSSRRPKTDRPRRPPPNNRSKSRSNPTAVERKRAPHQFDHTKADARPFLDDPATYVKQQSPNNDAPSYIFPEDEDAEDDSTTKAIVADGSHIKSLSLDKLFPNLNFSEIFCTNTQFRKDFEAFTNKEKTGSTTDFFYVHIAKPFIDKIGAQIPVT